MNKSFKYYALIWSILFLVFQVICFVIPKGIAGTSRFSSGFWIGYIFIVIAFVGQLVCAFFAFKADSLKKMFYNIPLIFVSYAGLILMLIVGALTMLIPGLPAWVGIIACLLVLAFNAIAVVMASAVSGIVGNVDNKVKTQTLFIRSLTVDAESLSARAKSDEMKAACKKVYEAVRYSDPMSNASLSGIESEITIKFAAFSDAVAANDTEKGKTVAAELLILIGDRNKKCKLLK